MVVDRYFYEDAIEVAWKRKGKNLPLIKEDPIVVAVYAAADLALQYYVVLRGVSQFIHTDLIQRKAEVVKWTGLRYRDALDYAKRDEVELLGSWLPYGRGTEYEGASPVLAGREMVYIVAVSGQDHRHFDQPFADAIAEELNLRLKS